MPELPALDDKIFFPISIFVLNVVLAIFKFVLVSAVGACFVIYARLGGEYANSVRWVRSAGYLEMVHTLRSTNHKHIPTSVKWALILGFLTTLAASFLDKGIAAFVTPVTIHGPPKKEVIISQQAYALSSPPVLSYSTHAFFGWYFTVPTNGSVLETMKTALNSSIANPNATNGYAYTPVTSNYNVTCANMRVQLVGEKSRGSSCGTVSFFSKLLDDNPFIRTESTPGRGSIFVGVSPKSNENDVPISNEPLDIQIQVGPTLSCGLGENFRRTMRNLIEGFDVLPTTTTTKCFHKTGEITAIAMTSIRFTFLEDSFSLEPAIGYFDTSNELVEAMEVATRKNTMAFPPGQTQNQTDVGVAFWIEYRVTNTTIDIFACDYGEWDARVGCIYSTVRMLHVEQSLDKDLQQTMNRTNLNIFSSSQRPDNGTGSYDYTFYLILESFTGVRNSKEDNRIAKVAPASVDKMRSDTAAVVDYMARLGYNYFAKFENGTGLYIQYEVEELLPGLEVPFWVLVVAGILLVFSFLLWQLTYWLIGAPHNSSLYSILRARLSSRTHTHLPKVMRFRSEPLMFEDVLLLPDLEESPPEKDKLLPGDVKSI